MSDQDENDQVYKVDTVPPPDGESDAYNAPTRVGQMAATTIAEMLMAAGDGQAVPPVVMPAPHRSPSTPPPSRDPAALASLVTPAPVLEPAEMPRLHEPAEDDDASHQASPASTDEASSSSFSPMPLTPAEPPVFTSAQMILIGVVVAVAAVGVYLLFS